jgi:TatD DNase family protein
MLIDTHCHLDFTDFDHDRDVVLNSALELGVEKIIVPAVSQASWSRTSKLCATHSKSSPSLYLALGMHPVFIDEHQPQHLAELDELIDVHTPVAIGEIGLDYYLQKLDREKQRLFFTKQLIIANRHALPVIIHCRKAHDDCLQLLRQTPVKGGIIHAFNGSIQQAQAYLEMGFLLGFGGMLTYPRSRKLRGLVKQLPLTGMVLETDAPDMVVAAHQGERNSPAYLPMVAQSVAEIKQVSVDQVAMQTSRNVQAIIAL